MYSIYYNIMCSYEEGKIGIENDKCELLQFDLLTSEDDDLE